MEFEEERKPETDLKMAEGQQFEQSEDACFTNEKVSTRRKENYVPQTRYFLSKVPSTVTTPVSIALNPGTGIEQEQRDIHETQFPKPPLIDYPVDTEMFERFAQFCGNLLTRAIGNDYVALHNILLEKKPVDNQMVDRFLDLTRQIEETMTTGPSLIVAPNTLVGFRKATLTAFDKARSEYLGFLTLRPNILAPCSVAISKQQQASTKPPLRKQSRDGSSGFQQENDAATAKKIAKGSNPAPPRCRRKRLEYKFDGGRKKGDADLCIVIPKVSDTIKDHPTVLPSIHTEEDEYVSCSEEALDEQGEEWGETEDQEYADDASSFYEMSVNNYQVSSYRYDNDEENSKVGKIQSCSLLQKKKQKDCGRCQKGKQINRRETSHKRDSETQKVIETKYRRNEKSTSSSSSSDSSSLDEETVKKVIRIHRKPPSRKSSPPFVPCHPNSPTNDSSPIQIRPPRGPRGTCYARSTVSTATKTTTKATTKARAVNLGHICELCGKFFTRRDNLKKHQMGIHKLDRKGRPLDPTERYICNKCPKPIKFSAEAYWREHDAKYHAYPGRLFPCRYCEKNFKTRSLCTQHESRCKVSPKNIKSSAPPP